MSSAVTIAAVTTAVVAAGSAAYSIANKPTAPKGAATPTMDSGAANTTKAVTDASDAGPGRAANIAAGDSGPSLSDSADDQYSVKKKLLGD